MKSILIWFSLVLSVMGVKEDEPPASGVDALSQLLNDSSISQLLSDPNLWIILKKRLGDIGSDGCSATNRRANTIIKTKDSLDAGAIFISSPSVQTERQCKRECCAESLCTAAVVKDKNEDHNADIACYLFNCLQPSVCIFTSHPGFTVLDLSNSQTSDRHVEDLYQLGVATATSSATTTTTTTTMMTTTPMKVVTQSGKTTTKLVGLFSECRHTGDCREQNTDCLAGYCVCQQGFHVVEMHCRKDCNQELEFECSNKGFPLVAECIAVYDFCDGTTQCSDGSDEISCTKHDGVPEANVKEEKLQQTALPPVHLISEKVSLATVAIDDDNPTKVAKVVAPEVPMTVNPERTDVAVIHNMKTTDEKMLSTASSVEIKQKTQAQDTDLASKEDVDTETEDKKYFWKMETNRGAVVALVLGIVLTTMLLVFAGCRLRHFRKRYRKGRHVNSNEADYLVNGMYL